MWHVVMNVVCHWALICCGSENDIVVNNNKNEYTCTRENEENPVGSPKGGVIDQLKSLEV